MKKTKIVALDIGGVCVHLQPEKALAYFNLSNLPARSLQLFDQLERGQLAENDFITQAAALLPETVSAEKFMTGWAMIIGEAMEGMNELVEEFSHKRGVEFVFLSDISTFHLRVIRERFYSEQFISNGIYSFEVGAKKPESPMYEAFEKNYGKPILYTDDRQVCIDGGKKFNWNTYQFQSAAGLREKLNLILSQID
ncbi:MAG: hypothetical protein MST10_01325 [Lentisphaeria bacterium]|nr:hypothetical protein [Lentisphaeria bacterium]